MDKFQLLKEFSTVTDGYGIAEFESQNEQQFLKDFLPFSQYRRLFEPNTFLILGGRGAGKTELFKLLNLPAGRSELYKQTDSTAFENLDSTEWITAFVHGKKFPTAGVIEKALANQNERAWRTFWLGLLTGALLAKGNLNTEEYLPQQVKRALTDALSRPSEWLPLVDAYYEQISDFLDEVDNQLTEQNQWLFVMYDELDKIIPTHQELAVPIRTLLAYWLEHSRRWQRIKAKIFLRTDLFREDFLAFADASKLRPHLLRLEWSTPDLYQLLTKRLANKSKEWQHYLEVTCHIPLIEDEIFGKIPKMNDSLYYEKMMTALIGRFMGANARKGKTYTWIPNHLQDGDGKITPRSFLKLFTLAAEYRLQNIHVLTETHLLLPQDLQAALQETSTDRIGELAEEYPWLISLQQQLKDMEVPTEQERFIQAIQATVWGNAAPPTTDAHELIRYLQQLGIIEIRLDQRINVPEIYLYGFKMKRRGGVKRAK